VSPPRWAKPSALTPYPWQRIVADRYHAAAQAGQALGLSVAAAPGAGKTIAALMVAEAVPMAPSSVLIIAPPGRVARQWLQEAQAWALPGYQPRLVGGSGHGSTALATDLVAILADGGTAILPWSRLQRKQDWEPLRQALDTWAVPGQGWHRIGLLVLDEAHYAQAAEAGERGKAALGHRRGAHSIRGLRHFARHVLALSGTPVTSKPNLIRAQLLFARADRGPHAEELNLRTARSYEADWWGGRLAYNYAAKRETWVVNDEPEAGHAELIAPHVVTVSTEELRAQLPAHRRLLLTDLAPGAGLPEDLADWTAAGRTIAEASLPMLQDLAIIRREDTEARAPEIAELAAQWHREAPAGRLLLVWTAYQESAEVLATAVEKALHGAQDRSDSAAGGMVIPLHGGMGTNQRRSRIEAACAGKVRVLVATFQSTGTGVDGLQHVSNEAIVAEAPWTPGEAEQLEGRLARTGQALPVRTRWVCVGIEAAIIQGIGLKAEGINTMMSGATTLTLSGPKAESAEAPNPATLAWVWRLDRHTGEWLAAAPHRGADDWAERLVEVTRPRDGKVAEVRLLERKRAGEGWSMWSYEFVRVTKVRS
jgi:hypothetical protein